MKNFNLLYFVYDQNESKLIFLIWVKFCEFSKTYWNQDVKILPTHHLIGIKTFFPGARPYQHQKYPDSALKSPAGVLEILI